MSADRRTLLGALVGTLMGEGTPLVGERFSYAVTVTTPAGETATMSITTATTEAGAFRAIVLPTGEGKGPGKTRKGRNWTDPNPEP